MKKLFLANILIFLSAFTLPVSAEDMNMAPAMPAAAPISDSAVTSAPDASATETDPNIDPTLAFFTALSTCSPGNYQEKNIISTEVGQSLLNQQIIGPSDDQTTCNVILSTPDNRKMSCEFPMSSLSMFSDQHFLQGMNADTTDSPAQGSVTADMNWSQMKVQNCSFDN